MEINDKIIKASYNYGLEKLHNEWMETHDPILGFELRRLKYDSHTEESANILKITVGKNIDEGGDCGHGTRTYIKLEDLGGTALWGKINGQAIFKDLNDIELMFGGSCERQTLISCLEKAVEFLKKDI